jgi:hypothetical protein
MTDFWQALEKSLTPMSDASSTIDKSKIKKR